MARAIDEQRANVVLSLGTTWRVTWLLRPAHRPGQESPSREVEAERRKMADAAMEALRLALSLGIL